MSEICEIFVKDAHGYTRADTPWIVEEHDSVRGRFARYFSWLGLGAFGRTVSQEIVRRRRISFLRAAACIAVLWLAAYLI